VSNPPRPSNGIRSSYELTHSPDCTNGDPHEYAVVREIAVPDYVVIDDKTRVMRAVYR